MSAEDAKLHQHYTSDGPNTKWISADGHFEMVFNSDYLIKLIGSNPEDMVTYNYYPAANGEGHALYDVAPWIDHGNCKADTTTWEQRMEESGWGLIDKGINKINSVIN